MRVMRVWQGSSGDAKATARGARSGDAGCAITSQLVIMPSIWSRVRVYTGSRLYFDCATMRATSSAGAERCSATMSPRGVITEPTFVVPNSTTPLMIARSLAAPTPSISPSRRMSSSDSCAVGGRGATVPRHRRMVRVATLASGALRRSTTRSGGNSSGKDCAGQRRAIARGTSCPTTSRRSVLSRRSRISSQGLSPCCKPMIAPSANTVPAMPVPAASSSRCGRSR